MSNRTCKVCKGPVAGRSDKIFCSLACKNDYHVRLRRATLRAARQTDIILHRNRSILFEVMGKNKGQKKVLRSVLDRKKFNYKHFTGLSINSRGKTYYHIYDFSWMEFSDLSVLIVRR